jgi:hypothetical protein
MLSTYILDQALLLYPFRSFEGSQNISRPHPPRCATTEGHIGGRSGSAGPVALIKLAVR